MTLKEERRLKTRNYSLIIWGTVFITMIVLSIFAPLICQYDPMEVDLSRVLVKPNNMNIFGTDDLGRDVFSRVLYGGRITILVGILSVTISTFVGVLYGAISGYSGGIVDDILMRILDTFLSIPSMVIMLALQAIVRGGTASVILIIGFTSWFSTARVVRSQFVELKEKGFVKAAVVMGTPKIKIITNHLLLNSLPSIIVIATFNCAHAVLTEVSLSYLGIGVPPHIPSWGNMLNNAQKYVLTGDWWTGFFPGLMIVIFMLSINCLGENLKIKYNNK